MNNPKMSSILEGLGQVNERQKAKAHKRMLKHNAEEIEKERKEQDAPKDAEYDAESGYFLKPGETDIYWSQKNKAYTLKWNGKDFVDESIDEAKGSGNQLRAMGKKMQLMAQVASNDVIMSFNDGKGDMLKTLTALRTVYAYSKELIEQFEDALRKVQGSL